MPVFVFLTGLANLFGIGGASLMSRCLGAGNYRKAKKTSVFCIWSASALALLYGILLYAVKAAILPAIGANAGTYAFCSSYIFWTITLGAGIPREVLLVGLPSCLMNFMGVLSNITINKLMAGYFNEAVAAIGIAKKVDMLSFAVATGMSQGVLPLILSLLRKGRLDIPFMFIMNALSGINGVVWATPIADVAAMLASIILFIPRII